MNSEAYHSQCEPHPLMVTEEVEGQGTNMELRRTEAEEHISYLLEKVQKNMKLLKIFNERMKQNGFLKVLGSVI